jgi:hypothetical protein
MTRSERIAARIIANCDAYNAKQMTHAEWDAEQLRLWKLAERSQCARAVCRLVAPPFHAAA